MAVEFRVSAVVISEAEAVPEAFKRVIRAAVSLISLSVFKQSIVTQTSLLAAEPFDVGLVVHL